MENKTIIVEIDEQSKMILNTIHEGIQESIKDTKNDLLNLFNDYKNKLDIEKIDIDSKHNEVSKKWDILREKTEDINLTVKNTKDDLIKLFDEYKNKLESKTLEIQPKIDEINRIVDETKSLLNQVNDLNTKLSYENEKIQSELSDVIKELKWLNQPFYKRIFKKNKKIIYA